MLAALLMSSLAALGADAKTIGPQDIVTLVKRQDPRMRAAHRAVDTAIARERKALRYPNPEIEWYRESLSEDGVDSIALSLPIDLSSRRATRGYLAASQVSQAKANAAKVTSELTVQALSMLFELVAHQSREVIEAEAVARLSEAARIVKRRREEGSASGYDLSRIEIETELAMSTLRQTRASAERLHSELANFLGLDATGLTFRAKLDADLSLSAGDKHSSQFKTSYVGHMRDAATHAQEAYASAGRAWVPDLVVSGGPRVSEEVGSEIGYILGVSLEVPVFSRSQDLRDEAFAERRRANARAEATERAARGSVVRAQHFLRAARDEVNKLSEKTYQRIERLERAAQSGYREGQLTIVELLDAQRVRTQVEMQKLKLKLAAKKAEVGLRAARGEYQ